MAIIKRKDPFWSLNKFFEEWSDWSSVDLSDYRARAPRMDIYEEGGDVVAEVELPGLEPENVEVKIRKNLLSVEAKKGEEKEEKEEGGYYRKELSKRYYRRTVSLPSEVDDEKAEAELKDGVLSITVPKVEIEEGEDKGGTKVKVKKK